MAATSWQNLLESLHRRVEPKRVHRWLLVVLAMFFLAGTAMRFMGEWLRPLDGAVQAAGSPGARDTGKQPAAGPRKTSTDVATVISRNLFGPGALAAGAGRGDAPLAQAKAELGLTLVGTMVGESGSAAVINDQQQRKQAIFRVGQAVRQGITVLEVRRLGVVLATPEGEALLSMEDRSKAPAPPPAITVPQQAESPRGENEPITQHAKLSRSTVEQALNNLPKVMNDARINPVPYEDATAYRVENIRPGSIYTSLGLRNGDVIYGLNGEMIQSQDQLLKLLTSGQENAVMNLMRGGQKQDVSVTMDGGGTPPAAGRGR